MSVYDILLERGFIEQATHEKETRELLEKEKVTFYIGFDPTADSLHVGHFVAVMAMSHMQRAGHRPLALLGGGTGMIGDPSGKSDMRQMMTNETINHNIACFKKQLSRFMDFGEGKAMIVNNADWLLDLNYIDFLKEVGVHFSVNRMLAAECFKQRLETGLSFFEFNYMIMQSYDFLELYRKYDCKLQMGGNDQWSNIISGVDLVRRLHGETAFGLTFSLLTTSAGNKMGKTEKGAVWLDPNKTSPYEFYQYWRNIADADVERCLSLLTYLPMDEVRRLGALEGSEINKAKEILAFEITQIVHGEEEASKAAAATKALFEGGSQAGSIPTTELSTADLGDGMKILTLLQKAKMIPSQSEGRRLISQGGIRVNEEKVESIDFTITTDSFSEGPLMIQRGKKVFHRIQLI